jgi:hypothetical protein
LDFLFRQCLEKVKTTDLNNILADVMIITNNYAMGDKHYLSSISKHITHFWIYCADGLWSNLSIWICFARNIVIYFQLDEVTMPWPQWDPGGQNSKKLKEMNLLEFTANNCLGI